MKKIFSFSKSQNTIPIKLERAFLFYLLFFLLLTAYCLLPTAFAQAPPQGINYQAVARDASGNPLASQTVSVTFRIRQTSSTGTVVYRGAETYTTNQFGLFTAIIGQTASDSGIFSSISWGSDVFYLQVLVNGNNMGATQFMSVPYSLYSANGTPGPTGPTGLIGATGATGTAGTNGTTGATGNNGTNGTNGATGATGSTGTFGVSGSTGQTIFHNGSDWTATSNLYNNGTNVGIGTTSPAAKLEVVHTTTVTADAGKFTLNTSASGVNSAVYADVVGTGSGNIFGIYGRSENQAVATSNAAVKGLATGSAIATVRYGGDFSANGPGTNFGISAMATGASNNNIGGYFSAFGGTTNYAAIFDQGNVGIGTATPGAKLEIVGSSGATIKIADGNQGANKVLTSDAAGVASWQTPVTSAPGFSNMQIYSTAGTFTFTTGASVTRVMVEVWGGGGGGSAIVNSEGGSAGGYGKEIFSVTPSTNYNVTVGAGGIGVLNSTGTNGGTSSFGLLISATGGGGAGGLGGTSSAAFNITGGSGAGEAGLSVPGVARTCFGGTAGGGGGAGGMYSSTAADPKRNGIAPGGGGAGGCGFNTGASGASGRVVIWW